MKIEIDLDILEHDALRTLLDFIKENGPPAYYAMRTSDRERKVISALAKIVGSAIS